MMQWLLYFMSREACDAKQAKRENDAQKKVIVRHGHIVYY